MITSKAGRMIHNFFLARRKTSILILPFVVFFLGVWVLLSKFIRVRKKKDKIIVGFTNLHYSDNSKAVFERMKDYSEKFDYYWIARSIKTFLDVRRTGEKVVYQYFPFTAIYHLINTDVFVTSDALLPFLFQHRPKVVQLWHGMSPKGVGRDFDGADALCVASEFAKQRHIELWNVPLEKIYVTGYARMDGLLNYIETSSPCLAKIILLYAPTWDVGLWSFGKDQYREFEKFCEFCKENDLILILRVHEFAKVNKRKLRKITEKYDVFYYDMSKVPDTNILLALTDVLITDWSSIYTDYFLTQRPIIYLEVDKEYFTKKRGVGILPPEYRAGEIVHSDQEFYEALKTVITKGNRFQDEQKKLLKIIHGNVDGRAAERVVKVIESLIE